MLRPFASKALGWVAVLAGAMTHGMPTKAETAAPFAMFSAGQFDVAQEHRALLAVLGRYLTGQDYIGVQALRAFPELAERIDRSHRYALPPSLASIDYHLSRGCGEGTPGLLIHNSEHWDATPIEEQTQMVSAIARGQASVGASVCHTYGIAPDGRSIGIEPQTCSFDLHSGILSRIDWTGIALFNIQAQVLLGDRCRPSDGLAQYVGCVTMAADLVRRSGHKPAIVAQLSFRDTPPERMIEAIGRLRGRVDGFYLAYPTASGRRTPQQCRYCTPENLAQVLAAIRTGV